MTRAIKALSEKNSSNNKKKKRHQDIRECVGSEVAMHRHSEKKIGDKRIREASIRIQLQLVKKTITQFLIKWFGI